MCSSRFIRAEADGGRETSGTSTVLAKPSHAIALVTRNSSTAHVAQDTSTQPTDSKPSAPHPLAVDQPGVLSPRCRILLCPGPRAGP
eukprot:1632988-Prymnesium_polylepis.1